MRVTSTTDFTVTAALLAAALAVGGAGLSYPGLQVMLGLVSIAAAAFFAVTERAWHLRGNRRVAVALVALALLLPLLQLIPLPPAVWHAIPGREAPVRIDATLGWNSWRPLTLDVEGTIRSFLTMLPAAVVFMGCLSLPTAKLERLLWVVIVFALISSALGFIQFATGGGATPYQSGHSGYPIGLFVNRNHQASFMLVAMPIVAAVGAIQLAHGTSRRPTVVATLSALVVFAIIVLATTSRMGVSLLPIAFIAALVILFRGGAAWRLALPSIFGVVAIALLVFMSGRADRTLARFSSLDDPRFGYWTDIHWTLHQYALAGSGFGTFIPVYQAAESLEGLSPAFVNHAHNDYLEILLEGGVVGIGLLLLFFLLLGMMAFKLSRSRQSTERGAMVVGAAAGIAVLLLSSIVDYPLRMPALGALFALMCALLLPRRVDMPQPAKPSASRAVARVDMSRDRGKGLSRLAAIAALAGLAVLVVEAGASSMWMMQGRYFEAAAWAPWSTRAHESASTEALLRGQSDVALHESYSALLLSPISASGLRSAGLIAEVSGQTLKASRLMDAAAGLGWRDPLVQLWVIDRAARSGESTIAVQRAQALFMQERFIPAALVMLLRASDREKTLSALAAELALQPPWRRHVLAMGASLEVGDLPAFEQLLNKLDLTGPGVSVREARPFADRLIEVKDFAAARRVSALARNNQPLINGDFETLISGPDGERRPDGWSFVERSPRLIVARAPAGGRGNALRVGNNIGGGDLIRQRLVLLPGTYVLAYRTYNEAPLPIELEWKLNCLPSGAVRVGGSSLAKGAGWQAVIADFAVPIQDCPIQTLVLRAPGDIHGREFWIDDVRLSSGHR